MKYIIHSKSERGFWHSRMGWVYSASTARKFTEQERETLHLPISSGNDTEWIVYTYDE